MPSRKWTTPKSESKRWLVSGALLCAFVLLGSWAFAEEGAAPPAGGSAWGQHAARLQVLSKLMESNEKEIHEMIEQKRATDDAEQVATIVKALTAKHAELEKNSKEYEELRTDIRFNYPERNDTIERQYAHYKLKTLDEMESEFGIDGKLDHIKAHVLATFPLPPPPEVKPAEPHGLNLRKPASEDADEVPGRIHLVK